uniref:CIPA n=1 Tax=Lentinula edodes TaxID=5353 RepID=A4UX70_LENED|nr:CIPA [Lentinula edodes]
MSQKWNEDKTKSPPPYNGPSPRPYRESSQRRPGAAPLQSEDPKSTVSGAFFAGAHNFDINGGAFQNASGDINHTVNNDHSQKSDFNNNYSGSTNYNGNAMHNDYKGSTNYSGSATHNDHKGATNNTTFDERSSIVLVSRFYYLSDFFSFHILVYNYSGRRNYPPEPIYSQSNPRSSYPEPAYGPYNREGYYNNNTGYKPKRASSQHELDYRDGFKDGRGDPEDTDSLKHQEPAEESVEFEASEELEEPGVAQLRQCVETFLAGPKMKAMPDLADTLVKAGWDREALAHSEWGDIKDSYKGSGWIAPMFVKLRNICKEWNA